MSDENPFQQLGITDPMRQVEQAEFFNNLIQKLKTAGLEPLVEALLQPTSYTRKGRLNLSGIKRATGLPISEIKNGLQRAREIAADTLF